MQNSKRVEMQGKYLNFKIWLITETIHMIVCDNFNNRDREIIWHRNLVISVRINAINTNTLSNQLKEFP